MNFNASQIKGVQCFNKKGGGGISPMFFVQKAYNVHYQKSMTINNTLFPSPFKAIAFLQKRRVSYKFEICYNIHAKILHL